MALNLNVHSSIWRIDIVSKSKLSQGDRDLIVDLVNEIARQQRKGDLLVLHEVIESQRYCQLYVEANESVLTNAISVMKEDLPYTISYRNR